MYSLDVCIQKIQIDASMNSQFKMHYENNTCIQISKYWYNNQWVTQNLSAHHLASLEIIKRFSHLFANSIANNKL